MGGVCTAGNSSTENDGAAAVVVTSEEKAAELGIKPLAAMRSCAVVGDDPRHTYATIPAAVQKALAAAQLTINQIDLIEVQEAFEKLSRGRLVEGYGLTEASPVTHANPLYGVRKVGSIGVPIPNTEAKIVDLVSGQDLPAGQVGELVVRGPQVMPGYWGDDDDEEEAESVLKDGWLYTGDVAVMDSDGYFKLISRKRDTIMAGDFSVYPRDVEEVLYENSKVLEAAVVGVPTVENGRPVSKVKAFVVPRPGTTLSEEELLELCRRRLDEYAVPWEIEFRAELPKSFVGKVLRRMLVEA